MKIISSVLISSVILLSFVACDAQIKNATTTTVKIYGNCGMCESTIENAGNKKKEAIVDWDKDTKMAIISYDAKQTNPAEILKRIAQSGYDSDQFLAPDAAYDNLPACCQYTRVNKTAPEPLKEMVDHSEHAAANETVKADKADKAEKLPSPAKDAPAKSVSDTQALQRVFEGYFAVKDALVNTDAIAAAAKSSALLNAINAVNMASLPSEVHTIWMKVVNDLKSAADNMSKSQDIAAQRKLFIALSENMYDLIKVAKMETPVYYEFCPMANDGQGANWLSKENIVKNPYYGSQMMSCGKVVETIK